MDPHVVSSDTGPVEEAHTDAGPRVDLEMSAEVISRPEEPFQLETAAREVSEGYHSAAEGQDSEDGNKAVPVAAEDAPAPADSPAGLEAPGVTDELESPISVDSVPKEPEIEEHGAVEEVEPLPSPSPRQETQEEEKEEPVAAERSPEPAVNEEMPPGELSDVNMMAESPQTAPEAVEGGKTEDKGPARAVAVRYPLATVTNALAVMQGCLQLAKETLVMLPPALQAQLEGMEFLMEPERVMHEAQEGSLNEMEAPESEPLQPLEPEASEEEEGEGPGPEGEAAVQQNGFDVTVLFKALKDEQLKQEAHEELAKAAAPVAAEEAPEAAVTAADSVVAAKTEA